MIFGEAAMRPFVPTERCLLVGARWRRFEQLRKTGNVYGVCGEVFAARLMPPKLVAAGSDRGLARECLEEGCDVAIKLQCVTVSVRMVLDGMNRLT